MEKSTDVPYPVMTCLFLASQTHHFLPEHEEDLPCYYCGGFSHLPSQPLVQQKVNWCKVTVSDLQMDKGTPCSSPRSPHNQNGGY